MATRKTLIKSEAGVNLHRVEQLASQQKRVISESYRLSSLRPNATRLFADPAEAETAFDLEVIASLNDPVVIEMQRRGLID